MTQTQLIELFSQTSWLIVLLSAPILATSLVLGLGISIFQAVTQIQEQTLTFVPKILTSLLVFVLTAPWLIDTMLTFATGLFEALVTFAK